MGYHYAVLVPVFDYDYSSLPSAIRELAEKQQGFPGGDNIDVMAEGAYSDKDNSFILLNTDTGELIYLNVDEEKPSE